MSRGKRLLFLLLAGLVVYSVTRPGAGEGLRFLFGIDPARLSGDTLVGALGQSFFSLSVGMGIMVTYGSYVPKSENLAKSAGWICALDTLVAFLTEEFHLSRPSACRRPWRCSARATPSPSPPGGASTCPGSTSKTGCRCSQ